MHEKWGVPPARRYFVALRVGCDWDKETLDFRGAPSLIAQVLPVDLPRAVFPERPGPDGDPSRGKSPEAPPRDAAKPTASPDVAHMSWDPSGRRLAVAFADAPAGTRVFPAGAVGPVSYTHLTLPTN